MYILYTYVLNTHYLPINTLFTLKTWRNPSSTLNLFIQVIFILCSMTFLRVEHFDLRVFSKYILPLDPGVPAGHRQRLVDGASLRLQLRGRRQVQAAQAKVGHSARPRSQ